MVQADGKNILLMGIVNLTDDSFYPGSRAGETSDALARIRQMVLEGADIVDLGAWSSRPGAPQGTAEDEWVRLEPVLQHLPALLEECRDLKISIDTPWSEVIRRAFPLLGRRLVVNDISAGRRDGKMLPLVAELELEYIAMHALEQTADESDYGGDVTGAVLRFFEDFSRRAEEAGVQKWVLDPGFGFGKSLEQNWALLEELDRLEVLGRPILAALSRKSMIFRRFSGLPEYAGLSTGELAALPRTLRETLEAEALAVQNGATALRVHDVKETVAFFRKTRRPDRG